MHGGCGTETGGARTTSMERPAAEAMEKPGPGGGGWVGRQAAATMAQLEHPVAAAMAQLEHPVAAARYHRRRRWRRRWRSWSIRWRRARYHRRRRWWEPAAREVAAGSVPAVHQAAAGSVPAVHQAAAARCRRCIRRRRARCRRCVGRRLGAGGASGGRPGRRRHVRWRRARSWCVGWRRARFRRCVRWRRARRPVHWAAAVPAHSASTTTGARGAPEEAALARASAGGRIRRWRLRRGGLRDGSRRRSWRACVSAEDLDLAHDPTHE